MPLHKRSIGEALACWVLDKKFDGTLNIHYLHNTRWICLAAHKVAHDKFEVPYEELLAVNPEETAITSDAMAVISDVKMRADLYPAVSPIAEDSDTNDELDLTQIAHSEWDELEE